MLIVLVKREVDAHRMRILVVVLRGMHTVFMSHGVECGKLDVHVVGKALHSPIERDAVIEQQFERASHGLRIVFSEDLNHTSGKVHTACEKILGHG